MPVLLLFNDFPTCRQRPQVLHRGSVSNLKIECANFFRQKQNQSLNNLLCVISDDQDWEVLYPVIYDGGGKNLKQHPKDSRGNAKGLGWTWDSNADNEQNHRFFTDKLKKAMGELPSDVEFVETGCETADEIKSRDHVTAGKKEITESAKDLKESKEIIDQNFALFQEVYREKYNREFETSEDVTMFYRNRSDIKEVMEWNQKASTRNMLIDPCAFNEMILGNTENPDIVILGKNPGAAGIDFPKTKDFFKDLFAEMKLRQDAQKQNIFFPFYSPEVMENLPWFSNRLIFGSQSDKQPPYGILSKFAPEKNIRKECSDRFRRKIVSLELVPYHTVRFQNGARLFRKFGVLDQVRAIVEKAITDRKIILCPYYGAVPMWIEKIDNLKRCEFFYTTHLRYGQTDAAQDGNLNIAALRHCSMINTLRTDDKENCDDLFKRLQELGWNMI